MIYLDFTLRHNTHPILCIYTQGGKEFLIYVYIGVEENVQKDNEKMQIYLKKNCLIIMIYMGNQFTIYSTTKWLHVYNAYDYRVLLVLQISDNFDFS